MDYSNYLHLVPSNSSAGALKFILPKGSAIVFMQLDLETGPLPFDLSKEEYLSCKEEELANFGNGNYSNLFGADLTKYDGVVVWHSTDVRCMLMLSLICASYNGKIQVCDVSELYPNTRVENLSPFQLESCLSLISPIPKRTKNSLAKKYRQLCDLPTCVKKYSGGKFSVNSTGKLKEQLLRNVKHKPLTWQKIIWKTMAQSKPGEFYPTNFWECLLLELVCEGRLIISEMVFDKSESHQFPLGCCLTNPYLLNGYDLRKLYSFKCFKPKITSKSITVSPRLTQLQVDILNILHDFNKLSSNSDFVKTEKVVMIYYSSYSNTANGEPINKLIDTIYAMAQPWRIKTPLLIARGYMGTPEQCDYEYSGAADMFYTEVSLSPYGKEVITRYLNLKQR